MTGTYTIANDGSRELLRQLGYLDFSGSITLNPDGTFSGSRIPFCCLYGEAEAGNKSKVGYWDLGAKWKLTQGNYGIATVELSNAHETGEWHPEITPHLSVTTGRPTGLAFSIFTSGDFYDVVFSRPGK